MPTSIFTADFKDTPFWWERTPRPQDDADGPPKSADVVVVGAGYTGLSAAIQTARRGRHTVVLDAEAAGWGCSSRNGGQVSPGLKLDFPALAKKFGAATALNILREGDAALAWIETCVAEHRIDCDYHTVGRFHGAHSNAAFDALRRKISEIPPELVTDTPYPIAPGEHLREVGSAFYHGGAVYPRYGVIDPARYHHGLLAAAKAQGAEVIGNSRVGAIRRRPGSGGGGKPAFVVETDNGTIHAGDVLVATNGYTGPATPWLRRRIIPIASYMIATEPLPAATIARLIPNHRIITDTRRLVVYYRACPERRRILFGGRVSLKETNPRASARLLHRQMCQLFPELESARVSHSWMGLVGYSFDQLPHTGKHAGVHYSMGYCGAGIALSSYLGTQTGLHILGDSPDAAANVLGRTPFPGRPYYHGNPWFLAPSIFYYRWRDARESKSRGGG